MMSDLDADEQRRLGANIAWLEKAGPDDWHRVALDFNWGEPLYVLDWIVRQPDCDVATALTIFWQGEPSAWLEEEGAGEEEPNGFSYLNRQICAYISKRVAAGGYTRSKITFSPDTWTKQSYLELSEGAEGLTNPNIPAHKGLIRGRWGRTVENDHAFYARYPQEFHYSTLIDLPEPRPGLMDRYNQIEQAARRALPSWLRNS
jgi:uncharacterized protein DUF4274